MIKQQHWARDLIWNGHLPFNSTQNVLSLLGPDVPDCTLQGGTLLQQLQSLRPQHFVLSTLPGVQTYISLGQSQSCP